MMNLIDYARHGRYAGEVKRFLQVTMLALAAGLGGTGLAAAQSSSSGGTVNTQGAITAGHCASFATPNTIQDSGGTCGGGGGTLTPSGTITTNQIAQWAGATSLKSDALLGDNGTTLAYTGSGGVTAPLFSATGSAAGQIQLVQGTTGTAPTNGFGLQAPAAIATGYLWTVPAADCNGLVAVASDVLACDTLGTGVATALAVNVGTAGSFVTNGGALGTPSGGTLTNATGLPISAGVSGLGTGVATALGVNTNTSGGFPTQPVANGSLANASITIGGTSVALGGSTASFPTPGAIGGTTPAAGTFTTLTGNTSVGGALYKTSTNCAAVGTAANPSVAACTAAAGGAFSCATNASTGTCTVSTTAVTANSEIIITAVADEGTRLSVTCNTTADTGLTAPRLATKTAATGFTINLGTFATNPLCFDYFIVN